MITQKELKALLNYDPETGLFSWKERDCNNFNSKFANKVAGSINSNGYVNIEIFGKCYKAHRLAWFYTYGFWPKNIDHISGVRSNNSISNLRSVTCQQNNKNAKKRADNSTGLVGVSKHNKSGKWRAYISLNGKVIHLGLFDCLFEACCARKSKEVHFDYHPNHGRA